MIKSNYQIRSRTTEDFLSSYWSLVFVDVAILLSNVADKSNKNDATEVEKGEQQQKKLIENSKRRRNKSK